MLQTIARAMAVSGSNNMFMSQEALLVLGPEHASIAARRGFDKKRVRRTLFEEARIPFEQIGHDNADVLARWRGPCSSVTLPITRADGAPVRSVAVLRRR